MLHGGRLVEGGVFNTEALKFSVKRLNQLGYFKQLEGGGKEVSIDKFEAATSIQRRFYAPDDWATSDLAVEAAKNALADAGITPEQLDMILLGTDSPDYTTPATSVVVQHKLGAVNAGTFDIGCACAWDMTSIPNGVGAVPSQRKTPLPAG